MQLDVVDQHARQFYQDVPVRRPGSQEELAAATYLLGHLEQAGYAVRLEGVPVADLVRSTNVLTVPPEDDAPAVLVCAVYDTGPSGTDDFALGIFLEIARAAAVSGDGSPRARFAALGAEHADESGGHLGSRRLAQVFTEQGNEMSLSILIAGGGPDLLIGGSYADHVGGLADRRGYRYEAFSDARFMLETAEILGHISRHHLVIAGPPEQAGALVLELISEHAG